MLLLTTSNFKGHMKAKKVIISRSRTDTRFLRATARSAKRVSVIVETSVLVSVYQFLCQSVTPRYCVKTTQARITRSSLWAATSTLVYRDKILRSCV